MGRLNSQKQSEQNYRNQWQNLSGSESQPIEIYRDS